jgi:glycosyltransferase involved in cell wall biosynthesis
VARQTVKNLSVVVVDDSSTDNSEAVIRRTLESLNDSRFRYLRTDQCSGQTGAVRKALESLSAPFVCILDSDDYWYDIFVERHLAAHLNSDFPIALTYCDSHIVDAKGQLLAGTAWWFDYNDTDVTVRDLDMGRIPSVNGETGRIAYQSTGPNVLHTHWSPEWSSNSTASMMFRRSFVDLVLTPPDAELHLYLDFFLSTLAALLTGAVAMPEALYAYRMHGNNKHSNASVLGGAYNSSRKRWEPIREAMLKKVLWVLQEQAESIRDAFGDYRYELALLQMRTAVRNATTERGPKGRSRLHELLWGS